MSVICYLRESSQLKVGDTVLCETHTFWTLVWYSQEVHCISAEYSDKLAYELASSFLDEVDKCGQCKEAENLHN